MADSGYPSPTSPPCGNSPGRLHTSTQEKVQSTLTQLESLWDDLGLSEEQRTDRKGIFYGHIENLLEKILVDEKALKSRIINNIENNTIKIIQLCKELILEPEQAVDGLTLLDLDAVLQERLDKLQQTKADRQQALRNLQEKDEGLCELLSEEPYYIPSGLVPSLDDLQAVEQHIKAMEKEKDEREAKYRKLKNGLLCFLEQLEQSPEDTFTREVVCSDDEDIALGQATLQKLMAVHSDLEFQTKENMAKSLDLRERISSLWTLLEESQENQQAFLSTAPGHTPSSIAKLEGELERLKILRLHNLSRFVEKVQKELSTWWEKCYVGEEEQNRVNAITSDELGEDVLMLLEVEVERWKKYYFENHELFVAVEHFLSLYRHMLELEERAKDPSRLFNTRGGALLQEEKAKRKVKNELPRVQEKLQTLATSWEEENRCPFMVYGQEVMAYLDHLWETHERKLEEERAKRVQAKEGKVKVTVSQPKTPGGPTCSRKRGMEAEEHPANKKPKHLPITRSKSPMKPFQRSPSKTPRGKPLAELNRAPPPPHPPSLAALGPDYSIQSITYDKFKADILEAGSSEIIHSSILEEAKTHPKYLKDTQNHPKSQKHPITQPNANKHKRRLQDVLNLASPTKGTRRGALLKPASPTRGSGLRRTSSQPCLGPTHRLFGTPRQHARDQLRFLI